MNQRLAAIALASALQIDAAAARDYCSTRPSLGQSACVLDAGRSAIETGLVDWERDDAANQRTDTILFADTLVRTGISNRVEAQIGWTPFGAQRSSDRESRDTRARVGDVSLGTRIALRNPDGSGFSFGLQPSITLPVGRRPVGSGDWSASMIVPMTYDVTDVINLQLSSEVAAAANDTERGRHLYYGTTAGVEIALSDPVHLTVEGQWYRNDEKAAAASEVRAAAALAWMPQENLVLDIGGVGGLNQSTPDFRLYAGFSRRF